MNSPREQETEPQQPTINISPDDYTYGCSTHHLQVDDMVWARSESCGWWPGRIFKQDIFAAPPVQITCCVELPKPGGVPVVFFGNGTYGWFDPKDVIPFSLGARTLPKQASDNYKSFQNAVSEAFHEASRRENLAVVCKCHNSSRFEPAGVEIPDYVHVDVPAYIGDMPSVYSLRQIDEARRFFDPAKLLDFMKTVTVGMEEEEHFEDDFESFLKMKGMMSGYRSNVSEAFRKSYREVFSVDVGSEADENQKRVMKRAITQGDESFSAELKIVETPSSSHNNLNLNWQPSSSSSNQSTLLLLDLNCPPAPLSLQQPGVPLPLEQLLAPLPPEQLAPFPLEYWPSSSSSSKQSTPLLLEQTLAPLPLEQPEAPLPLEQPLEPLPPDQLAALLRLEQPSLPVEQFIDELRTELNNIRHQTDIYNLALRYNSLRPYESHQTENLAILLKLIWNIYPRIPHPVHEPPPDNWVHSFAHYLRDRPRPSPVRHRYNQNILERKISNDFFVVKLGGCGYEGRSISLIPFRFLMGPGKVLARARDVEPVKNLHVLWFKKVAAGLNALNIAGNRLIEANDIIHLLHVTDPTTAEPNDYILRHVIRYAENVQANALWGQRIVKYQLRKGDRGGRIFFQLTR